MRPTSSPVSIATCGTSTLIPRSPRQRASNRPRCWGSGPSEVEANGGETERLLRAVFETGQEQVQEFSYAAPDGDRRWQMRLVPERGPDGTVVSVVTVARDITDRYRAEAALRASEQQFRAVFETALDAMVIIDDAGVIIAANPAAARAAGLPVEGLEGRAFLTLLPGDTGAAFHQRWTQSRRTSTLRGEVAVALGDGRIHHFEYQIDAAFLPGRHLVVARDVTERDTALDALRSSEERFRHVARATGEIFWDWDVVNDSVYWNEALATQLGYAPADLAAPDFWSRHLHPDDQARARSTLTEVIHSAEMAWEEEYRLQRADGSYAYMLDRGLVTRDATGRAVRMVGAMIDLSARRAAEEALRQSEERFAKAFHGSPFALAITRLSELVHPRRERPVGGRHRLQPRRGDRAPGGHAGRLAGSRGARGDDGAGAARRPRARLRDDGERARRDSARLRHRGRGPRHGR